MQSRSSKASLSNMIDYIHEVENIAEKYGLQITSLDATCHPYGAHGNHAVRFYPDLPEREEKQIKHGLGSGNNRIYGADSEGGIPHEHPIQQPWSHIETEKEPELEEFIFKCLRYLQERNII